MNEPTWYLLYGGTSEDGRGHPRYCGRTTDMSKAAKHFAECESNPYSIGEVRIITETQELLATKQSFLNEDLIPKARRSRSASRA